MKHLGTAFLACMLTSAVWFLALHDGTLDLVKNFYRTQQQTSFLQERQQQLQLETNILRLECEKRYWKTCLDKLEQHGF
jgi:hypothetical protein